MKYFLFGIVISLLLFACANKPEQRVNIVRIVYSISTNLDFYSTKQQLTAGLLLRNESGSFEVDFLSGTPIFDYMYLNEKTTLYYSEIPLGCYGGMISWWLSDVTEPNNFESHLTFHNIADICLGPSEAIYIGNYRMNVSQDGIVDGYIKVADVNREIRDISTKDFEATDDIKSRGNQLHKSINIPFAITKEQKEMIHAFGKKLE